MKIRSLDPQGESYITQVPSQNMSLSEMLSDRYTFRNVFVCNKGVGERE